MSWPNKMCCFLFPEFPRLGRRRRSFREEEQNFFLHFFHSFSWIHVWQVGCNVVVKCLDWKILDLSQESSAILSLMIEQLGPIVDITKISARENVSTIFFRVRLSNVLVHSDVILVQYEFFILFRWKLTYASISRNVL